MSHAFLDSLYEYNVKLCDAYNLPKKRSDHITSDHISTNYFIIMRGKYLEQLSWAFIWSATKSFFNDKKTQIEWFRQTLSCTIFILKAFSRVYNAGLNKGFPKKTSIFNTNILQVLTILFPLADNLFLLCVVSFE